MRELSASPSASRTVGQTSIRTGMSRSRTSFRITSACWASFWPKYADVRAGHVEELGHHRGHALEVLGAALRLVALERRREAADGHVGVEAVGVDLLHRRREEHVHALGLGQLGVALLVARVGGEVLARRRTGRGSRTGRPPPRRSPRGPGASATGGRRGRSPSSAPARSRARRGAPGRAARAARRRCGRSSCRWPSAAASARVRAHQLVEQVEQLRRRLLDRGPLRRDGGVVAAGHRPRERLARARARRCSRPSGARGEQAARGLRRRPSPAPAAIVSAAASSVTRKFEATDAAAW